MIIYQRKSSSSCLTSVRKPFSSINSSHHYQDSAACSVLQDVIKVARYSNVQKYLKQKQRTPNLTFFAQIG